MLATQNPTLSSKGVVKEGRPSGQETTQILCKFGTPKGIGKEGIGNSSMDLVSVPNWHGSLCSILDLSIVICRFLVLSGLLVLLSPFSFIQNEKTETQVFERSGTQSGNVPNQNGKKPGLGTPFPVSCLYVTYHIANFF